MGIRNIPKIRIKQRSAAATAGKLQREIAGATYDRKALLAALGPVIRLSENEFQLQAGKPWPLRDRISQSMVLDIPLSSVKNFMNFCRHYNAEWSKGKDEFGTMFWEKEYNASSIMQDQLGANYGRNKSYRYFHVVHQEAKDEYGELGLFEMTRWVESPSKKKGLKMSVRIAEAQPMTANSKKPKSAQLVLSVDQQCGPFKYQSGDWKVFQTFLERLLTLPEEHLYKSEP